MTLSRILQFQLNLSFLEVQLGDVLRLRFSIWRDRLPIDALPVEGWIEVPVVSEEELAATSDHAW